MILHGIFFRFHIYGIEKDIETNLIQLNTQLNSTYLILHIVEILIKKSKKY